MYKSKRRKLVAGAVVAGALAASAAVSAPQSAQGAPHYTMVKVRFVGPESANRTKVHLEHDTMTPDGQELSYRVWPEKTVRRNVVRFRVPTTQTKGLVLVYDSPRSTLATDATPVVIQTYKKRDSGAAISARYARNYAGRAAWGWGGTSEASVVWKVGVTSRRVHTNGSFGQHGWKRIVIMYRSRNQKPVHPAAANWLKTYKGTVEFNGEPWVIVG